MPVLMTRWFFLQDLEEQKRTDSLVVLRLILTRAEIILILKKRAVYNPYEKRYIPQHTDTIRVRSVRLFRVETTRKD